MTTEATDQQRDFVVTSCADKPLSGMWHCGPNPTWVTVTHKPTGIQATARHRQPHKARQVAMACVELMIAENDAGDAQFPETLCAAIASIEQ